MNTARDNSELDLAPSAARTLWVHVQRRLDTFLPEWRALIEHFGQVAAVERRESGGRWSDDEVFGALLRAVLSNNTDWAKVERVMPELQTAFFDFSLTRYADTTDLEVAEQLVPWFNHRKAGSMTLRRSLVSLRDSARILRTCSALHGSAEQYFLETVAFSRGDAKLAAVALGMPGDSRKLPALGIPLAAETLRNLGFDICKPDRHVCRAVGAFGLVSFKRWMDRVGTRAPAATPVEMLRTMQVVETLAGRCGIRASLLDNALWLLGAHMGLRMSNIELSGLMAGNV